ncbi:MAG: MbnP family protein [Bacteroidia bacterium]
MKKSVLIPVIIFLTSAQFLWAQKPVQLQINHLLGDKPYSTEIESSNDLTNTFTTSRVEYYISKIALVHSGGTNTDCSGVYVLANANDNGKYNLGQYEVENIEAIQFYIGVNSPENNDDPTQWPEGHALAPKMPSMHWGWSSGYRFVCMEGNTTSAQDQQYQVHALGNQNYFGLQIPVSAVDENDTLVIKINADYTQALSQINIANGLIVHGDINESVTLLKNFSEKVFSSDSGESSISLSSSELLNIDYFDVYPNPSNGPLLVSINNDVLTNAHLNICDLGGRIIYNAAMANNAAINLESGVYIIKLLEFNKVVAIKKVMVH